MTVREIAQMTNIDPWFLHQLKEIGTSRRSWAAGPLTQSGARG